jgi:hypothetical protein
MKFASPCADEAAGAAVAGAARLCSDVGTRDINWDNADWAVVPADVPVACATPADRDANTPRLVLCGGEVNGVTCAAVEYCASVAAIAEAF